MNLLGVILIVLVCVIMVAGVPLRSTSGDFNLDVVGQVAVVQAKQTCTDRISINKCEDIKNADSCVEYCQRNKVKDSSICSQSTKMIGTQNVKICTESTTDKCLKNTCNQQQNQVAEPIVITQCPVIDDKLCTTCLEIAKESLADRKKLFDLQIEYLQSKYIDKTPTQIYSIFPSLQRETNAAERKKVWDKFVEKENASIDILILGGLIDAIFPEQITGDKKQVLKECQQKNCCDVIPDGSDFNEIFDGPDFDQILDRNTVVSLRETVVEDIVQVQGNKKIDCSEFQLVKECKAVPEPSTSTCKQYCTQNRLMKWSGFSGCESVLKEVESQKVSVCGSSKKLSTKVECQDGTCTEKANFVVSKPIIHECPSLNVQSCHTCEQIAGNDLDDRTDRVFHMANAKLKQLSISYIEGDLKLQLTENSKDSETWKEYVEQNPFYISVYIDMVLANHLILDEVKGGQLKQLEECARLKCCEMNDYVEPANPEDETESI